MAREVFRYKNRREKNRQTRRNVGLILLFTGFWMVLWMWMKRHEWWGWLKTWFY